MKALLLCGALFLAACSSSKTDDPTPPVAATPTVAYTDAAGTKTNLSSYSAYSVTAPPVMAGGTARRAIVLRTTLPNGSTLDLTYIFAGAGFPTTTGRVTLDEGPTVDNYGGTITRTQYKAPVSTGTLSVESLSPQVVSSTYTGPLVSNGANVSVTFTKAAI